MKLTLGTNDARTFLHETARMFRSRQHELDSIDVRMGVRVTIESVKPDYTRQEEAGFHWLLSEWLRLDPELSYSLEDLKEYVCAAKWGVVRLVGPGGQEKLIASRRTTRKWDHDAMTPDGRRGAYVPTKLSREEYAELMDFTQGMAAEKGVVLPDCDKTRQTK